MHSSAPDLLADFCSRRVGTEARLEDTVRDLNECVRRFRASLVGALQVVCSDESERECSEVFQRRFVQTFLPSLKFANPFPFRTVNLGGRYEWGSVRIAENHFSGSLGKTDFKLIVIKINSHVSVVKSLDGPVFGRMPRYRQEESHYCGALHGLVEGRPYLPHELLDAFTSEGKNRVQALRDSDRVSPSMKYLYAAIVNARLQAREAVVEIQDFRPNDRTVYLVVPCVTLNRSEQDTEINCGLYTVDWRGESPDARYQGLGDDPTEYEVRVSHDGIQVEDPGSRTARAARDHRLLALDALEDRLQPIEDRRIEEIRDQVASRQHQLAPYAGVILKSLVALLLELSPIPAVLFLFGEGLIDIRNIYSMQRISSGVDGEDEARGLLAEVHGKLDSISTERAGRIVERFLSHHGQGSGTRA